MSSRQYTVTVKLKGDDTLRKLEALANGSPGMRAPAAFTGAPSGGDVFRKLEALGIGQLAKLTGIGLGVTGLVHIMEKSSGQLQGLFKLWESGMMLIFKPMGDFVALALRPITIALLTQFIIPFYRSVYPFFRDYGTKFGNWLANQQQATNELADRQGKEFMDVQKLQAEVLQHTWDQLVDWFNQMNYDAGYLRNRQLEQFNKFIADIGAAFASIPKIFIDLGTRLWNFLSTVPGTIGKLFLDFGQNLWNYIFNIPAFIGGLFTNFGENLWNGIQAVPNMILDVFTGLASNLRDALSNIPKLIYDAIMSIWRSFAAANSGNIPSTSRTIGGTPITATKAAAIADSLG